MFLSFPWLVYNDEREQKGNATDGTTISLAVIYLDLR